MPPSGTYQPLQLLGDRARTCRSCPLETSRTQVVFGDGDPDARLMIVGEAPGADEDQTGRPFQGSTGRMLDAFLAEAGIRRRDIYIANVVMCRPPGNRPPVRKWIDACARHLDDQIQAVEPAVILALGATSTRRLLGTTTTVKAARGRVHATRYGPVVATYHPSPSSLNRSPDRRGFIRSDFQSALHVLWAIGTAPYEGDPAAP